MKTVLVVDDSRTIRTAVAWTLRGPDLEVVESASAEEAQARINERRPDLVLLDVTLDDSDGLALCQTLKARPGLANVPILLMGSALEPLDPGRAASARADGHVEKPFDTQTLIDLVRSHAGLPDAEDAPLTYAGRLARQRAAEKQTPAVVPAPPPVRANLPVSAETPARVAAAPPPSPFAAPAAEAPSGDVPGELRASARLPRAPSMSIEVRIDETDPIEIDTDELELLDTPVVARQASDPAVPSPASNQTAHEELPAGPVLEPPPAPAPVAPQVPVDVWALADEESLPAGRPPPPRMPPPRPAPEATAAATRTVEAVVDRAATAAASQVSVPGLSKDELRAIAREAIESVVWEVVPDLAETIIRAELARLTAPERESS